MSTYRIFQGDSLAVLRTLPAESVHCCVTSPPYWGLRDYGVAGQLGLEKTPEEYVSRMVELFREVRRVLRDDGTLWLNLGDAYSHGGHGARDPGKWPKQSRNDHHPTHGKTHTGLKPKDLVGIPWRVAFALQQPHYIGGVKRFEDRVWLAAMMDGEGCFYIHKRKAGQHAGDGYMRQSDNYAPAFEVANTSERIIQRCVEIAGCGSIIRQDKDRRQPLYRWTVRCDEARQLARELHPHLVAKQQQARIICGLPSNGERAEAGWVALKALHAGVPSDIDFPAPASCHEPGWYLRSDVIWSKPNPMPESVTDRPTKAHEYLFLLSKSEKYYYDGPAIAERSAYPGDNRALRNDTRRVLQPMCADNGSRARTGNPTADTRNRRSVWTIATQPYPEAHFATYPEDLVRPCILAGCPQGGTVLEPFAGSGTTLAVAVDLGCEAIGIELNPAYIPLIEKRLAQDVLCFEAPAQAGSAEMQQRPTTDCSI